MRSIPGEPYRKDPCPRCGGLVQLGIGENADGTEVETVEMCTTPYCPFEVKSYGVISEPSRAEIREAVHTIRQLKVSEVSELQCPSCYGHMCWRCTTTTCRCGRGPHPKREA